MQKRVEIIGHRGWRVRHPENTLNGLIAAAQVSDGVEVDVRRSSDGKLLLAHDPELGGMDVATTGWSELGEVDLGGGVKPCLLDEALASIPGTPAYLEIKNTPGEPGHEPDHRLGLEAAASARTGDVVISFNWETVDTVAATFPELATGLNVGVLGDVEEAIRHCRDQGHRYLMIDVDLALARAAPLPAEIRVAVWSTQPGDTFAGRIDELVSMGVWGIITDDPQATTDLIGSLE